ncbi:hypothetical protein [Georgenia sp. AZ-5]|uniref:hypothetical protein n=1 Tax=Georgenia sp. AZ-5 TaxID=3367526 RepID=UPI0037541D68
MAVYGDPSRPTTDLQDTTTEQPTASHPARTRVVWMHPSELPVTATRALGWGIGRGLDLQLAMAYATVRAPFRAAGAVRRTVVPRRERLELDTTTSPTTTTPADGVELS